LFLRSGWNAVRLQGRRHSQAARTAVGLPFAGGPRRWLAKLRESGRDGS
jgi:hypothetical protein